VKTRADKVISQIDPSDIEEVEVVVCPTCDNESFNIWFFHKDMSHPHLQCDKCKEAFCANEGDCAIN